MTGDQCNKMTGDIYIVILFYLKNNFLLKNINCIILFIRFVCIKGFVEILYVAPYFSLQQ